MEGVLQLCWDTFPWICEQATILAWKRRDVRFSRLGGELFILTKIPFPSETENPKLIQIAGLVDKACSLYKEGGECSFNTLCRILKYKDADRSSKESLTTDINSALTKFVLEDPDYPVLIRLIADCVNVPDPEDTTADNQLHPHDEIVGYPTHVNNTLYAQLEKYATCSCTTEHLRLARLRLDPEHDKRGEDNVQFELVFVATSRSRNGSRSSALIRWKEARVLVARHHPSSRKRVGFDTHGARVPSPIKNGTAQSHNLRDINPGDFCRLIRGQPTLCTHFHVKGNIMSVDTTTKTTARTMLPHDGTSLLHWLEEGNHIPKRVKVMLAYTIARSVWQYYNSYWMVTPWTHETIQLLKERINTIDSIQPHLFLTTKLRKLEDNLQDFYQADDLMHMHPNILALAVVLIEIATGQPFRPERIPYMWNETTINDYFDWAYLTAHDGVLRTCIGTRYENVVKSCLDDELFKDGPIEISQHGKGLESRRSILFEKVVLPLQELYHAYRDNWEVQDLPVAHTPKPASHPTTEHQHPASRDEFTIAVFCALELEANAVTELFDDIWGEGKYGKAAGDDNTYTLGRMSGHNVVLVHMAGIGKGVASRASSSARSSYPGIQLALMVGVCGGVPSGEGREEIILGDVVISDAIVQYDMGRQYPDRFVSRAGHEVIYRPSSKIRGMLSKLKLSRERRNLEAKLAHNLKILEGRLGPHRTNYPGADKDELFQSGYRHRHHHSANQCKICWACDGATDPVCDEARVQTCTLLFCDKKFLVERRRLQEAAEHHYAPYHMVHFGSIGSGDAVMKSGLHRDTTAALHKLIAFEMEAAGVFDNLVTVVIKGVCDYSDSHKNKCWQDYAAATAAACMKAFLDEWTG